MCARVFAQEQYFPLDILETKPAKIVNLLGFGDVDSECNLDPLPAKDAKAKRFAIDNPGLVRAFACVYGFECTCDHALAQLWSFAIWSRILPCAASVLMYTDVGGSHKVTTSVPYVYD